MGDGQVVTTTTQQQADTGIFKRLDSCTENGVATFACIPILLTNLVTLLLIGSAIATLFMLILGGIKFSLSGGDPKKVQNARSTMTYAIIGVVLVFLSFIIIRTLSTITGSKEIDPTQVKRDDVIKKPTRTTP